MNPSTILYRSQQYDCRAQCKISEELMDWEISYGQTRFDEIWILGIFCVGYLYSDGPQGTQMNNEVINNCDVHPNIDPPPHPPPYDV